MNTSAHLCRRCLVIHRGVCPREQWDADNAERQEIAVARSTFSRWASGYVASLSALRDAGVKLGKEHP